MKKLFILSALAIAAISCSKSGTAVEQLASTGDEITFSAPINGAETKAGITPVTSMDSFKVTCVAGTNFGSSEPSTTVFANTQFSKVTATDPVKYRYSTGGKWWPLEDAKYNFYATNNGTDMTHGATGCSITAVNTSDVICAVYKYVNAASSYKTSIPLVFDHIFSRLGTTTVTAPDTYVIKSISITLTPYKGGSYNLYAGNGNTDRTGWTVTDSDKESSALTISSTPSPYTEYLNSITTAATDKYLVPGEYTLNVTYTLKKGDWEESKTKTAKVSFTKGKINNIKATLPAPTVGASEIEFTITITPWGDPVDANVGSWS